MTTAATMTDRRALIRAIMADQSLRRTDVAQLVHVSPDAVKNWLRDPGTASATEPPKMAVELLYLKLGRTLPEGWDA